MQDYLAHLRRSEGSDLSRFRIVLDCANGAATGLAQALFESMGAEVVAVVGAEPDGMNINHRCGSTHMFAVADQVVASGADLGLSFDGDADRLLACTSRGETVDGDRILAILARWLKAQGKLRENTLVGTVMSNLGLQAFCDREGIKLVKTAVGDRYVLEAMRRQDYSLGGEQSGHLILMEHTRTGDGLLTALALLRALVELDEDLETAAQCMRLYPQVLIPVPVDARVKHLILEDPELLSYLREVEDALEGGRVLVRPSGTEPLIRVMLEGESEQQITPLARAISRRVKEVADKLVAR